MSELRGSREASIRAAMLQTELEDLLNQVRRSEREWTFDDRILLAARIARPPRPPRPRREMG